MLASSEVQAQLAKELADLDNDQRTWIEPFLVVPRLVEVADTTGEPVVAVAEVDGKIVYWSEFEEGWEAARPNHEGKIPTRGCNQFMLGHLVEQLRKRQN